jgi:hypothetical protein
VTPQNPVPAPPHDPIPAPEAPVPEASRNPVSPVSPADAPAIDLRISGRTGTSSPMSLISLAVGLLTVAWPLAWAPAWVYVVAAAGVVTVLAATFLRWRPGPAIAVTAAIAASAFSRAGTAALAAEGLFILGYLLTADAPPIRPGRWLRSQLRLCVAAVIASGAVLAALALHPASSAWLAAVGLVAAVAAYLTALPSPRRAGKGS